MNPQVLSSRQRKRSTICTFHSVASTLKYIFYNGFPIVLCTFSMFICAQLLDPLEHCAQLLAVLGMNHKITYPLVFATHISNNG